MGTKVYSLHEDDALELQQLRDKLRGLRVAAGLSRAQLSRDSGLSRDSVSSLERGVNPSPLVSTLQSWGRALGVRVEFEVQDLWRFPHGDAQFQAMFRRSRPWAADEAARLFLVAAARQWRVSRGWDVEHVAPLLGQSGDSIRDWEADSNDPLVSRVMAQLRVMGARVQVRTFTREEWIFG